MAQPAEALVIVISAWLDDDGMRARLLHDDEARAEVPVYRSTAELVRRVEWILAAWERSTARPEGS